MIRLATVFSGIGAIEHALQRMGIDHKIVFACDNGDVEILTKNVGMNIDAIGRELRTLEKVIHGIQLDDEVESLYKMQLSNMLEEAVREFRYTTKQIEIFSLHNDMVRTVLKKILAMPSLKMSEKKKYETFLSASGKGSLIQKKFSEMQVILEISKDFKKGNLCDLSDQSIEVSCAVGSEWQFVSAYVQKLYEKLESLEGKKIVRRIQDLSQRTGQLHEKINYLEVQIRLKKMGDDWKARKSYVDSLYAAEVKRLLYTAIKETHNFVSITDVHGSDIQEDIDLLTYSFPCQDLSLCGCWHGNKSGIARNAHNRSGMLWEVERILKEMHAERRQLPHFLVMENVTNILSVTHKADFDDWKSTLSDLGYYNQIYRLNARNFGVPQKRERAYMISIRIDQDLTKYMQLKQYFDENDLQDERNAARYRSRKFLLRDVLKLDYSDARYRKEADASQPNNTPSRQKIFEENDMLFDGTSINEIFVNTVTTKQDRNPNSGLITYHSGKAGKAEWRYLTPRECFMLMGFDEQDYNRAISVNPEYITRKKLLTNDKMIKMAGNSICVDVLEAIFRQILEINDLIFLDK